MTTESCQRKTSNNENDGSKYQKKQYASMGVGGSPVKNAADCQETNQDLKAIYDSKQ